MSQGNTRAHRVARSEATATRGAPLALLVSGTVAQWRATRGHRERQRALGRGAAAAPGLTGPHGRPSSGEPQRARPRPGTRDAPAAAGPPPSRSRAPRAALLLGPAMLRLEEVRHCSDTWNAALTDALHCTAPHRTRHTPGRACSGA